MTFGVFIHRADSIYDDSPAERYQFPKQYLSRASACIGDWVVYYEPTKVPASKGYNAVARVAQVVPDPTAPDMYLALIEPGSYLAFANPVAFEVEDGLAETGLLNEAGRISGRAQAAVRPLSANDFNRIVSRGLADEMPLLPRLDPPVADDTVSFQFDEDQSPFEFEQERERVPILGSRILRDRVFRRVVLRAYDERCGVTGLKLINGGGRAEVAAAHIRPVEQNGPDVVNNGIALSGTAHWMFDRGLIGFSDDLDIIVSRHVNDRDGVDSLINRTGKLIGPLAGRDRPHPAFLQWHRENCFKQ
jgi:putative restriction endonuclease